MIIQVAFVCLVIFIAHKITECFKSGFSARNRDHGSGTPTKKPPAYSSLYPDLTSASKDDTSPPVGSALAKVLGWGRGTSFQTIVDKFNSLDEVSNAVRRAGLESSNLLFGEYCSTVVLY